MQISAGFKRALEAEVRRLLELQLPRKGSVYMGKAHDLASQARRMVQREEYGQASSLLKRASSYYSKMPADILSRASSDALNRAFGRAALAIQNERQRQALDDLAILIDEIAKTL